MRLYLALPFILAAFCGSALGSPAPADTPLQQGRSVAFCLDKTPVCAVLKDGRAEETYECQARHDQAVRIVPGTCWDED